jgi:alcohol dehydrogenase class IV
MPYFNSPKILFGSSMLKRLGSELQGMGNKAVVITDKNVAKFSDQLVKAVSDAGFEVRVWDGAEQEPTTEGALNASKVLGEFQPQLVIAFGGGSVIDTAKGAWILWERPDFSASELDKSINPRNKLNLRKKARFIAVPTTSGTGSEVNWAIVLTDKASHRKLGFGNNEIVPDMALLIPEFTAGMPKSLTASTGMDVLGHAFDGLTARQQNDFSEGLCLQAIRLAFEWLPKAYNDGTDMVAREKMQNAASIAGLGFGNSNTSLSHALGHAVGATFNVGHGRAVGVALPYSLDYISRNPPLPNTADPVDKLGLVARILGIEGKSKQEAAEKVIQAVRDLARQIGEPRSLKDLGITKEQLNEKLSTLVTLTGKDVNMFSCPCECKEPSIEAMLNSMFGAQGA